MQLRCPHCNALSDSLESITLDDAFCPKCRERFSLISDETRNYKSDVGRLIGHFRLIETVGQGAFGVVWRAKDTDLDRTVAIKMPRSSTTSALDARLFVREAQAVAQLHHPNIVSVHEIGQVDGTLYIVSDFVHGSSLSAWLKARRPTCREAAELCMAIAGALEHAHQAGVVHRDLKCGNILMDASGSPKVVDFGLAKRDAADRTMTLDGHIVGTPAYMSPEQAEGELGSVDHRADVYSMGVILFELITNERPFRGNDRMLLQQVIHDDPPNPRRLNGSVPRDLETICLKCLEKSPDRRYQSAKAFEDDLRRFLAGEPILARPVSSLERAWKWTQRRRLVASLSAATLLAIVLGLFGVTWEWLRVIASQRRQALTQVELIQSTEPSGVESAILGLKELREWANPELSKIARDISLPARDRFRAHLALIELEPDSIDFVVDHLLQVAPPDELDLDDVALGVDVLSRVGALPKSQLIKLATDRTRGDALRFRALFILASSADSSQNSKETPWDEVSPFAVDHIVADATTSPRHFRTLVDAFRPVHSVLLPALRRFLVRDVVPGNQRFTAASIMGEYAADRPEELCSLLLDLQPEQYAVILPRLREHPAIVEAQFSRLLNPRADSSLDRDLKRKLFNDSAIAAVTLLHLNVQTASVWPLFRASPDATLRTLLIHRCAEFGLPPEILNARLRTESDPSVRRALLLSLGEYDQITTAVQNGLRPVLEDTYRTDGDSGVHSAVAWLLHKWGDWDRLRAMDAEPRLSGPVDNRDWYVNSQGTMMIVIDHPPVFTMGAPPGEPLRSEVDYQHLRNVDRKFAIAATEVTWRQFEEYKKANAQSTHRQPDTYGPDPEGPVLNVSWVQAAKYCRWLSEREGIDPGQMCFPELDAIGDDMAMPENFMALTGYRLPTEGEWECACRAGTLTRRFFGDVDEFLDKYGWHIGNSKDCAWRVGRLKPNDYGLFDIYGNAWEWCLDRHGPLPNRRSGAVVIDAPKLGDTKSKDMKPKPRVLRGGSMNSRPDALRSAQRDFEAATHDRNHNVGFRIVRTLPTGHAAGD